MSDKSTEAGRNEGKNNILKLISSTSNYCIITLQQTFHLPKWHIISSDFQILTFIKSVTTYKERHSS